jgi:sensor histidine kinase YesM
LHILFLFLFKSSVSFIFQIDSLGTRETIIAVSFLLVFWFLLLPESYVYIWIVPLSWIYLMLVSVLQEQQEGKTRGVSVSGYSECLSETRELCQEMKQELDVFTAAINAQQASEREEKKRCNDDI